MNIKQLYIASVLLLISVSSYAQFILSGEFRPRFEARHGYRTLPPEDTTFAAFVNQRSRINLQYSTGRLRTFLGFQEVRVWGGKGMFETLPGIGLHQAYVELDIIPKLSLRAGRQELRYDNQRLLGMNNWNQSGRTHDAAVLRFKSENWQVHLGTAFNQSAENLFGTTYLGREYKTLSYLWMQRELGNFTINGLWLSDGYQDREDQTKTRFRSTAGGIVKAKLADHSIELHGYYQFGQTNTGQDIRAWYIHPVARLSLGVNTQLNVGVEVFSGNDPSKEEDHFKAFHNLYGTTHGFNGHLDYFTNIPEHTNNTGLVNPYLEIEHKLNDQLTLRGDYHFFATHRSLVNQENQPYDRYLGSEIDFSVQLNISKEIDLQMGYSTMFASPSMEVLKGGSHEEFVHWGWMMLTVRPVFFRSKE